MDKYANHFFCTCRIEITKRVFLKGKVQVRFENGVYSGMIPVQPLFQQTENTMIQSIGQKQAFRELPDLLASARSMLRNLVGEEVYHHLNLMGNERPTKDEYWIISKDGIKSIPKEKSRQKELVA